MQIVSTITRAERRTTNSGHVIFDTYLGDGTKASTFDATLGDKAISLQGQQVVVDLETQQRGEYTNVVLKSVTPSAPANAIPAETPFDSGMGSAPASAPTPASPPMATKMPPDAQAERIARSVALRLASEEAIAANLPGERNWSKIDADVQYLLTGDTPVPF
jgi:hypothetical protein